MTPGDLVRLIIANLPRYGVRWLEWLVALGELQADPDLLLRALRSPQQPRQTEDERRTQSPRRYVMSSLTLHKSYRHLTREPIEDLHLATGVILDGTFVLNDLILLRSVERSLGGTSASPAETRRALLTMEAFGLKCGGLFHSHPGRGPSATIPSGTDRRNHETWEEAFPVVGGIFTHDGFVRFFKASGRPRVDVLGKKVRRIDETLFRLDVGQAVQVS